MHTLLEMLCRVTEFCFFSLFLLPFWAQVLDFFMIQNGGPTLKLVLTVGLYPHRATLGLFYSRSLEGLCTIGALDMSPSTRSFYLMIWKTAKKWREGGPELHKNENLNSA